MALFKFGPLVADARGSIGGLTIARNRAGAYGRQRVKPVVPVSTRRSIINGNLSDLVTYWQETLSTVERTVWDNAAKLTSFPNKLGDSYTPSGCNLFIRSNASLLAIGESVVTVPPVQPVASQLAPTLVHVPASGITITDIGIFDTTQVGNIFLQFSAALRQSINYFKGPWATNGGFPIATLSSLPLTLIISADLTINSRYFYRFVVILDNGAVSSPSILPIDVGAVA